MKNDISKFLDNKKRIKSWPSKKEMKIEILEYLASKFEYGHFYNEHEVNSIIENWHTFGDYFLLRRGLIDNWLLTRTRNGAKYWREEQYSLSRIRQVILNNYDFENIIGMSKIKNSIDSNSIYILCDKGEFIFREIENTQMGHSENDDIMPDTLKEDSMSVIYKTVCGDSVICKDDKRYYMQVFSDGRRY